jgi:hypothetical protein
MTKFEDIVSKDKVSGFWETERKRQEIESKKGLWVYDVESYPNFFSYTAIRTDSHQYVCFELSPWKDDKEAMLVHLKTQVSGMVGFNNVHYDQYLIQAFMEEFVMPGIQVSPGDMIARRLYGVSQGVINTRKHPYSACSIPQMDLRLLNHFDNKSKMTSLKSLMVRFKWKNVEDLPYHWSTELTKEQVDKVMEYNLNDVLFTKHFYILCSERIKMRKDIGKRIGKNLINFSDVRIGETIVLKYLADNMNVPVGALTSPGYSKINIPLKEIIFPNIEFTTPEFKDLLRRLNDTQVGPEVIKEYLENAADIAGEMDTNTLIEMLEDKGLGNNRSAKKGKKKKGGAKKGFSYRVMWGDFAFEYGIGGIHGCIKPGVYDSDDQWIIVDTDGTSFYPMIIFNGELHPRQFPKEVFIKTVEQMVDERVEAKDSGVITISDGLKLGLNGGIFGKSGEQWSPMYDPRYFTSITINGQLLLTMFAERILTHIKDAQILQINTDGVTFRVRRSDYHEYMQHADWWTEKTGIRLEHVEYKRMAIRDVNTYIAVKPDGKVKPKGFFESDNNPMTWHKDNSFAIVRKAALNYLAFDKPILETFAEEQDLHDYCGRYKATSGWHPQYVYLSEDEHGNAVEKRSEFGKTLRFIPVKKGGVCVKKHDDGRQIELLAGWRTMPYNKAVGISHSDIDMNFFYARTIAKIEEVLVPQTSLF